jgi:putative Mg2+ transporter-C (MgtC) family protein
MTWADLGLLPQGDLIFKLVIPLLVAAVLGGAIGVERERRGKAAGLRTQMLVCVGTALVLIVCRLAGVSTGDITRVIQGILPGIGFIGGGVILKLSQEREIKGLTTAATIWTTAAIGVAVGLGLLWAAILGTLIVEIILVVVGFIERHLWGVDHDNA